MGPDEPAPEDLTPPDMDELFAPVRPADAFGVVLSEAHDVLAQLREPIDAELWGSDVIGALTQSALTQSALTQSALTRSAPGALTGALVPAAEQTGTVESLALLRIFGAVGDKDLRTAAAEAADRLAASGVPDPDWAAVVGAPDPGECWHYADTSGRLESVTITFTYPGAAHALSVLIDHGRGGKIKDVWVADAAGLLRKTREAAAADSLIIFEPLDISQARFKLQRALSAGECPQEPDQEDDITAHRALLAARLDMLSEE
jgi:hypothetical protein